MISKPDADLPERIQAARRRFKLNLVQMAAELRIRHEWLSKIVNGHQPASYNVGLRFNEFLRQRGVDPATFGRNRGEPAIGSTTHAGALRAEVERHNRDLLNWAGEDARRLEWILGQLRRLRTKPIHEHTCYDEAPERSLSKTKEPFWRATESSFANCQQSADVIEPLAETLRPKVKTPIARVVRPNVASHEQNEKSRGDLIKARYRLLIDRDSAG